ncbi:MAG TPA: 4-(cytidine 5'-diphospho)-2-C-methyl-D-erythritol kinase [Blastocatellia bacterium]|nr:4-(cytidine 5'-diphospho)-2-C-methyl-D-erythritol kinase [Blastocatellia bacterium]
MILPSFAKINWTLEILGRRADGYHELRTLLQTVSLADELSFTLNGREIEIECDHPAVPCDESNLVYRAAKLLADLSGIRRGVRIGIRKRIPVAAGLGGGSSNAAVTLLALQRLWGIELAPRDQFRLGSQLGSDVPFFMIGGTCLGVGRGDEVYPLADLETEFLLLINAGIEVPTREVYAGLPVELTNPGTAAKMPLSLEAAYANLAAQGRQDGAIGAWLYNDLETTVVARYPLLSEIKERLTRLGARGVLMSGSGSTIFAIFDSQEARENALNDLSETGWWCQAPRTLGRNEYRQNYR